MSAQAVELAILIIQGTMSYLKTKGLNDAELEQVLKDSMKAADARPASELPNVPDVISGGGGG